MSNALNEKTASAKHIGPKRPIAADKKKVLLLVGVVAIFVVFIIIASSFIKKPMRTESYQNITGSAGLHAVITYDCGKQSCPFDFNVYIFREDGQQVSVVRPDAGGNVNLALPEGDYVMLVGKRLGKVFPQEPLALKNGQSLELKLHYR